MEENEKDVKVEGNELNLEVEEKPKKKKSFVYVLVLLIILIVGFGGWYMIKGNTKVEPSKSKVDKKDYYSEYRLSGNSLENFDLYFLQLENEEKNKIYSPLSIKYALAMLNEGTKEDSHKQIEAVIGDYKAKSYPNNDHMSFANAVFIKDAFKDAIRSEFTEALYNKFGAEVIYDTFETADNFNNWVSGKTFHLIDKLLDDISKDSFILVNALAIDMEWKQKIQATCATYKDHYSVRFSHEKYSDAIGVICGDNDYPEVDFDNSKIKAKSVKIGATLNRYDIVKELGEENIRKTVGDELRKWLADPENSFFASEYEDVDAYLDEYIKEINENYGTEKVSTDYMIVNNDEIKAFAKDLKEYDGITLQYVGIMPKNEALKDYVDKINADSISKVISELKDIKLENFKDGVVTKIFGNIPVFNFDYELKLKDDLPKLGIVDIFDSEKANLDGIAEKSGLFIDTAVHKANIDFSNDGIKAAAATAMGGLGASTGGFDYLYDVPVEEIDMTFDKPYLFLIRDKDTGEVWFTGTVYEPTVK